MKDYPSHGGPGAGHKTNITIADKSWADRIGDSESEEGILPGQGLNSIVKTTEFIVK
jgi:hypothetical protein